MVAMTPKHHQQLVTAITATAIGIAIGARAGRYLISRVVRAKAVAAVGR